MKNRHFEQLAKMCMAETVPAQYIKENAVVSSKRYIFIDNGADILGVCHWDTVAKKGQTGYSFIYGDVPNKILGIQSIALDDRLGAYILLVMLPKLGVKCDVLITTDEEIGMSTAEFFDAATYGKSYNWIFSFDRRGLMPVMYEYESQRDWVAAIQSVTDTTFGSFSDICSLNQLGVCGVNWGTGYYNEHSQNCYALSDSINISVKTFAEFYFKYRDIKFEFTPTKYHYRGSRYTYWTGYEDDDCYLDGGLPATSTIIEDDGLVTCIYCNSRQHPEDFTYNGYYGAICKQCYHDLEELRLSMVFNDDDEAADLYHDNCESCGLNFPVEELHYNQATKKVVCGDCYQTLHLSDSGDVEKLVMEMWKM